MAQPVALTHERRPAETCPWMDAGVVAFKLCDRGFDCAHCPLDAALRGLPFSPGAGEETPGEPVGMVFPADRLYSHGHTWIGAVDTNRRRFGLDAFAARLLDGALGVRTASANTRPGTGPGVCRIDLPGGSLPVSLPTSGAAVEWNNALDRSPGLLCTDPYGAGWLAEWTGGGPEGLDVLDRAEGARRRAELDGRHVCRRVAFELLERSERVGWAGGVETDIRRLLAPGTYLALLKELIH